MEAARSQGMSYWQAMYYIILPQAIRNVLPALGNDFVAMLKDSSLVSVLAVRDITQVARLYAGRSFRYDEAYTTLAVMYLTITIVLSLGSNIWKGDSAKMNVKHMIEVKNVYKHFGPCGALEWGQPEC